MNTSGRIEMKTHILRVVAEPPLIFWAPLLPAAGNVLVNITAMLIGITAFNVTPLPFFVTIALGHAVIAGYAARDPHLASLISAWMVTRRKTVNLLTSGGNKYVP
jgi:type IV secretory pathway VirB3-like protein